MKTLGRYVALAVVGTALCAPVVTVTRAAGQDEHRDQQKRVYDRTHKDYHNWNDNEDRAYHRYFTEQHKEYRDYSKLNRHEQDEYWNWRHSHPEEH